jgi:hypothetical protein
MPTRPIACPYDFEAAILRALEGAGMKQDVAAALMGISSAQFSNQIRRRGGYLSLPRFFMLANDPDGLRVLQLFWEEVAGLIGLADYQVALQLQRFAVHFTDVMNRLQPLSAVEMRMVSAELRALDVVAKRRAVNE